MKRHRYEIMAIDGSESIAFGKDGFILSTVDLGYIDVSTSSYSGSGQMGQTVTSRTYGTRDVSLEGHLLADDADGMRAKRVALQRIVSPMSDFWLIVDGAHRIRCMASTTVQYPTEFYRNNEQLCSFSIDCVCSSPFFEPLEECTGQLSGWISDFRFPYCNPQGSKWTMGHQDGTAVFDIYNESEVECGLSITVKAVGGTIVNPSITNVETMEVLKVNGTLDASETLEICTCYGQKSIRNATTNQNWLNKFDLNSTWLQIGPGATSFKCECDDSSTGTLDCRIRYTPLLLEV